MTLRCAACKRFFRADRSRTYCNSDYWKIRRFRAETARQLHDRIKRLDATKACIQAALHDPDDEVGVVAKVQRHTAVPLPRSD
jgi:hypothetical protein